MQLYAEKSGNHIINGVFLTVRAQRWGLYRLSLTRLCANRHVEWIVTIGRPLVAISFGK